MEQQPQETVSVPGDNANAANEIFHIKKDTPPFQSLHNKSHITDTKHCSVHGIINKLDMNCKVTLRKCDIGKAKFVQSPYNNSVNNLSMYQNSTDTREISQMDCNKKMKILPVFLFADGGTPRVANLLKQEDADDLSNVQSSDTVSVSSDAEVLAELDRIPIDDISESEESLLDDVERQHTPNGVDHDDEQVTLEFKGAPQYSHKFVTRKHDTETGVVDFNNNDLSNDPIASLCEYDDPKEESFLPQSQSPSVNVTTSDVQKPSVRNCNALPHQSAAPDAQSVQSAGHIPGHMTSIRPCSVYLVPLDVTKYRIQEQRASGKVRDQPDRMKHTSSHGEGKKTYPCSVCRKILQTRSSLSTHLRIHSGEKPYKCNTCGKAFYVKGGLTSHSLVHSKEKPYICSICGIMVKCKKSLSEHKLVHSDEKPYSCAVCGKTFKRQGNLTTHSRVHTDERPYACTVCEKTFRQYSTMMNHVRIHTGEKLNSCHFCGKTFVERQGLKRHIRIHTGEKPFKCSICDKAFTESGHLRNHKVSHTGERPFKCKTCGKTFKGPGGLFLHQEVHAVVKRHTCHICDKTFSANMHLTRHIRSHTGERPYPCPTCKKAFITREHLTNHIRLHTGERPYLCSTCGKTFAEPGMLYKHKHVHTTKKPHICAVCGKSFRKLSQFTKHKGSHTIE